MFVYKPPLGTRLLLEIMKMLQHGSAKNVDIPFHHRRLDGSPYDTILANQQAPRVLETHLVPDWISPKFR